MHVFTRIYAAKRAHFCINAFYAEVMLRLCRGGALELYVGLIYSA